MEKDIKIMKYDFSVIVVCYNPDIDKLKNTLYSILVQKDVALEIVVADDGSGEDYSDQLHQWFAERGFSDYKLVMNEQNQGTVKNLLSGLQVAEGKYTKNISPGDYLYDAGVLKAYYDCMEQEQLSICFGKAVHYSCEDGKITIYNRHSPVDLKVYRKKNQKKIRRNYFWFRDYALGACLAFHAEAARKYTKIISEHVRFAEDTAVICMLASGEKIGMLDRLSVWYEYGTGISTAASAKWSKILFDENKNVYSMLAQKDERFKKLYRYHFEGNTENRYWSVIRKCILYPPYFIFTLKALFGMQRDKECDKCEKEKLEAIIGK